MAQIGKLPAWAIDDAFRNIAPDRAIEEERQDNPDQALQNE